MPMHVQFQLLETFGKFKKKNFMVTNFSLGEFFVTIKKISLKIDLYPLARRLMNG